MLPEVVRYYYLYDIYYPFSDCEDDLSDELSSNEFLELLNKSQIDKENQNIPPNYIFRKFIIENVEFHKKFLVQCDES